MNATREAWLLEAVEEMRHMFVREALALPDKVQVSVGFPLGSRKAIGQCFHSDLAADGLRHIFVSPVLSDPVIVLATLMHECCHTLFDSKVGHKAPFARAAKALGLVKPWTATSAGEELVPVLTSMADALGSYPHGALEPRKKDGRKNPYHKVACSACGFIAYITPKMMAEAAGKHGDLCCPACQAEHWGSFESEENPDRHLP